MLKEMGDGVQTHGVQILGFLPLGVNGQNLIGGHRQHFGVVARFVFHFQDANGSTSHHHTWDQGHRCDHQNVNRVAITADGFGHIPVVGRVVHGRAHESIHKNRTRLFVHLVFDRVGIHRNFNDDVEFVGGIFTRSDCIE